MPLGSAREHSIQGATLAQARVRPVEQVQAIVPVARPVVPSG